MANLHVPMARLAVETALLANGTNLINFIGFIIKKLKEVRSYRDECSKLVNMSIKLSLSYLEHQQDLQKIRLGSDFLQSLQKVYLLVIECSQPRSIYHIGWEVFCGGKVEKMMEQLRNCQEGFNTETLININSNSTGVPASLVTMKTQLASIGVSVAGYQDDRDRLDRGLTDIHQEIVDNRDERRHFNQSINHIRREIEEHREEFNFWRLARLPVFPKIAAPNDRVILDEEQSGVELTGLFEGQAAVFQGIGCYLPRVSRIIKIHQMIAEAAPTSVMQKLYGVFEREGTEFLIMESGRSNQTLLDFVQSKAVQDLTMSQKISFCYDLVSLISILHDLDLVVKSITDVNILVQRPEGQNPRPKLINLQYIRNIREPSGREDIDWRFDAPETPKVGTRSKMSDVWSLGIILVEIFTEFLPFSTGPCSRSDYTNTHLVPALSHPPKMSPTEIAELAAGQVASLGSHTQLPFTNLKSKLPTTVSELVNSALARDPMLRPPASRLAQGLFELLLREANVALDESTDPETPMTKVDMALVERMIHEAKARKEAEAIARTKKEASTPRKTLFETQQIEGLLKTVQQHTSEPTVLFAVGSVYLWGLCAVAEGEWVGESGSPAEVLGAEKALSYLKSASEQGYEVTEELYQAHRVLAKFYHENLTRRNAF